MTEDQRYRMYCKAKDNKRVRVDGIGLTRIYTKGDDRAALIFPARFSEYAERGFTPSQLRVSSKPAI